MFRTWFLLNLIFCKFLILAKIKKLKKLNSYLDYLIIKKFINS